MTDIYATKRSFIITSERKPSSELVAISPATRITRDGSTRITRDGSTRIVRQWGSPILVYARRREFIINAEVNND